MKLLNLTRSFLFRILVSNVLLISLIIFILSTILYLNFKSIGTKIVTESILDRLYQTSYSTNYLQDASLGVIAQVYMDQDITDVMNTKGLAGTELYWLKNKLQRIVDASNFVDSISVYNGTGNNFFSTKDYSPESENEYLIKYVKDKKRNDELGSGLHPIPRIITGSLTSDNVKQVPVYSYIMYNDYKGDAQPETGVILNVKEDWMSNVIKSAGANYLGDVFILNQDGIVMSHVSQDMFLKDLSGQDYIKRVFHSGNTGYFTTDINNVRSLVTFVSSDQLGWKFISVLPFSTVIADIEHQE